MTILKALRHYALVSEMIGVEGLVTAELALMIVNLQSLGLSIALTSVPVIASALTSLVLIPLLGYITARCARTPKQRAFSLIGVNTQQILGVGVVILANVMRLQDDQPPHQAAKGIGNSTSILGGGEGFTAFMNHTNTGSPSYPTIFRGNDILSTSSGWLEDLNLTEEDGAHDVSANEQSQGGESERGGGGGGGLKFYAIIAIIGYIMSDSGYDTGTCLLKTFALSSTPPRDHPDVIVRAIQMSSVGGILVTLLGAVGVGEMLARGTNLNVNSVTVIFIFALMVLSLLPTAVLTLVTGLCCWAGLHGYGGGGEDRSQNYEEGTKEEKQSLVSDSLLSSTTSNGLDNNKITSSRSRQSSISRDVMERIFQLSQSGAHSLMEDELNSACVVRPRPAEGERGADGPEMTAGPRGAEFDQHGCMGTVCRFLKRQEKRLILCMASFFALGALFAFNLYSVNFVTVSICDGDSEAPPGSAKYENYLKGIKIGSTGLLVFYSSFVIGTTAQDVLLRRIGWWRETSTMFVLYIVCNVTCAIVKHEYVYYLTTFVSGLQRAMIFTIPYILVCRILTDTNNCDINKDDDDVDQYKQAAANNNNSNNNKGTTTTTTTTTTNQNNNNNNNNNSSSSESHNANSSSNSTSGDIALVASMLPLSMTLCALVIGPVSEATGDAAIPIYFSAISALLGFGLFALLRKY